MGLEVASTVFVDDSPARFASLPLLTLWLCFCALDAQALVIPLSFECSHFDVGL